MKPENEWARMCENPLTDDSGIPAKLLPNTDSYPSKSRQEQIDHHRYVYEVCIGCAELDDIPNEARITAYKMAIYHVQELGLLGVSPYVCR